MDSTLKDKSILLRIQITSNTIATISQHSCILDSYQHLAAIIAG